MSNQPDKAGPSEAQAEAKWDSMSEDYERNMSYGAYSCALNFIAILGLHNRQNILEISSGGGYLTCEIATKKPSGAHLTSLDLSSDMLSFAQTKLNHLETNYGENYLNALSEIFSKDKSKSQNIIPQKYTQPIDFKNLNVHLTKQNAENLDFAKENSFDAVLSPLCLHLVSDYEKVFKNIYKVLKPDSPMAFCVWGSKETSELFTMVGDTMEKAGLVPQGDAPRSPFHQNDQPRVLDCMEKCGFRKCKSYEAFTPMFFDEQEDGKKMTLHMWDIIATGLKARYSEEDLVRYEEIRHTTLWENYEKLTKGDRRPLGFSMLFYYGYK